MFYGWNNMTPHEVNGVAQLRQWLQKNKNFKVPEDYDEKDLLKFV